MNSKLKLSCEPREAVFDPALLDCRPEEKTVEEKLEQFAKRNTTYVDGNHVGRGAILRLTLTGDHPLCRNKTVEIAEGYHLFNGPLEDAMDGASVGDVITLGTEQGTLTARILSIKLPRQGELTDESVCAAGIPGVKTVEDYRSHVRRELAAKNRDRNRVLVYAQRSEDLIRRAEVIYDDEERRAWVNERLAAEKERMRQQHSGTKFDSVWRMNEASLTDWYMGRFDQILLERTLGDLAEIPTDASEDEYRNYAKQLLLEELPFKME